MTWKVTRILPLVPLAAWFLTLFIPIWATYGEGPGITVSSLGGEVLSLEYPVEESRVESHVSSDDIFIAVPGVLWLACLVLLAAYAWWRRPGIAWSSLAVAASGLIIIFLAVVSANPPFLMWDGVDEHGRAVGGMQVAYPWFGMIFWLLGAAALLGAGIAGLVGWRPERR